MPLLFPLCPIVIADIPFASLWPFPGKSLHKTIKILKCTNKNVSALILQPLHFLIHRRSLITPTILTRSLGLSASSSHLGSDFHVTSALIWQGSATPSSTILSRSQGFCFLACTLLLHIAEEQCLELNLMSAGYFLYGVTLFFPVGIILRQAECLSPLLFFLLWRHGTGQFNRLRARVLNLTEAYDRGLTGHHLSHKYFF